ncbi:unnamed protein product [Sphagnum troendelagicum]|uniref:FAD-binding domain-containing protein n=1 Tax=Sphagnum troendelagicum TaxID=128251 RepID=A0ABP0TWW5_9BRYO
MDMDVVIVGGGLGGLALAVGLRERGIKAQVYERAAENRHNTGTAISIGHNGINALESIQPGLALDQMGEFGSYTRILSSILPGVTPGEKDIVTRRAIPPGRMLMIPWKEARDVLVQNLDPAMIHYRHTFVHYTPIQVMRQIMIGDKPRDLKLVLWNAVVHNPDSALFKLHEKDELKFIGMGGKRVGFLMDVGKGTSILLRDGLGAEHTLWQLRAPDEDGELARTRKTDLEVHGQNALKMRVLKHVKGPELAFKAVEEAIEATDPQSIWERNLYDRLPLEKWTDPSGHVVLIGDAAHGMHPGPGEGARTTFEDAHQLSILLHNVFSTSDWNDKLHKALAQFEEVRIPRLRRIQAYAAELTGFRELIPDWVLELPLEEKLRRSSEFSEWTQTYPKNITGDAASTYWKP